MGPPLLSEPQRSQLGAARAGVVAFCSGSLPDRVDLRALFEQGLLQAAVVTNRNSPKAGPQPTSLQDCFDRSFLVITASNVAMLPTPNQ
jgi:hypothetical protein